MPDIGYLGALLGGVATIVSPCSVMLLPAFFAYAFSSRAALVGRTGLFYLGLITTLVPLGAAAGSFGALFNAHRSTFIAVAALLILGACNWLSQWCAATGRMSPQEITELFLEVLLNGLSK